METENFLKKWFFINILIAIMTLIINIELIFIELDFKLIFASLSNHF